MGPRAAWRRSLAAVHQIEAGPRAPQRLRLASCYPQRRCTDGQGRDVSERRRDTSAPFSKAEVARIREALLTRGAVVDCPRCGSSLTFERPATSVASGPSVWWINCASCQRNLIVHAAILPSEGDASSGGGEPEQ